VARLEQDPPEREDGGQAYQRFQERHRSLADRVERFLMQLVILGLVSLTLVQTLQVVPFIRRQISVTEALEGISTAELMAWMPAGSEEAARAFGVSVTPVSSSQGPLTLTVVLVSRRSAPEARLLVDGKPVGTFASSTVTVVVMPGQKVEVDGSQVPEELTFRVMGAPGLLTPAPGTSVVTRGDRRSLGIVQAAEGAG